MNLSPLLNELIEALCYLPGIGPKSAQRLAFYLLQQREKGQHLSQAIKQSLEKIQHCESCRTYSELSQCPICQHPKRDDRLLCIVETPADIIAIEQTHSYPGKYFVLHGKLSPLDGIGPSELGMHHLQNKLQAQAVDEIIIATNATVEGEATAHYIAEMARQLNIATSRIANGVPMGGELEYIDSQTLGHALKSRRRYEETA